MFEKIPKEYIKCLSEVKINKIKEDSLVLRQQLAI